MQRLKTRPEFDAVMAGATVSRTPHFVLHRAAEDLNGTLPGDDQSATCGAIGALVPKRWARRAVTRNLLKRQIYVLAAAFEPRLAPRAHVIRLRAAFDRKLFPSAASAALKQAVRAELELLLQRAAAPGASQSIPSPTASGAR